MSFDLLNGISIPEEVNKVMGDLRNAGFEAYLVGGCVRDFIMGKDAKDYDVTTNARPEEIHEVFDGKEVCLSCDDREHWADYHLIDTGIKQGTVTVIINHIPVEVTTYRTESSYSDGRHPDMVMFSTCLEEDLARRDFTINAIAYKPEPRENESSYSIVDPFNGLVDIENRLIRCVGNPKDRFKEDGLRIMRALRFSSSLDFDIEKNTEEAIRSSIDMLRSVSKERMRKELEGLLVGKGCERVLREYADIISIIIPEIIPMIGLDQCTPYHIYDVWEHTIRVVSGVSENAVLRFAALFHDIGKPSCFTKDENGIGHFYGHPEVSCEMATEIMRRLKFDKKTLMDVSTLIRWHDLRPEPTKKSVRKVIVRVKPELFDSWISLKRADNLAQAPNLTERQDLITEVERIGHRLIEEEGELSLNTLDINGNDLISLGLKPGPQLGIILTRLLNEVLEERIANNREALIEAAKSMI